jgi:hypothetical protein
MEKQSVFRSIALGLQVVAVLAFFVPPLLTGSEVATGWLVAGVLHTALFCGVFFRDTKKRTAVAVLCLLVIIAWCLIMLLFGAFLTFLQTQLGGNSFVLLFVYALASLLAACFALANPKRMVNTA